MKRLTMLVAGFLLLTGGVALAQTDELDRAREEYAECQERHDLDAIQELLWYHRNVDRVDASIYGLPKDDFDDDQPLTIDERLMYRRARLELGEPMATSGPLQYPHHLRPALDHYYETTGERPDCSRILEDAGLQGQPEAVGSGWASDLAVTDSDIQERGEVHIAIDPANPARMVASSCPNGGVGLPDSSSNFIAYTSNYGQSWTETAVGNNAGTAWECDPVSYYQRSTGRVYHAKLGCVATSACTSGTNVLLRYSTTNGASWTDCGARPGDGAAEDREFFAIDNTSGTGYGNIYVTWHNSNRERVARSTDNCATWVNLQNLSAVSSAITPDITVGANHHVHVVWQNHGDGTFKLRRSTDQGANWIAAQTLATRNGAWSNSIPAQCQRKVPAAPYVDVNRAASSPYYGRVHVILQMFNNACATEAAYTCANWQTNWSSTCNYDLFHMYSTDSGVTWSSLTNITSGDGNTVDHFMGAMRVDETDGSVWVSYHRSTLAPASWEDRIFTRYFVRRSTNGGASWDAPVEVSTVESSELVVGGDSFERGDYNHLEVLQGVAWPVWIDRPGGWTEEEVKVRKICSEPAHWSERATTPTVPATTTANGAAGVVNVSWSLPDLFWGDAGETPASRKFQLWVDGALATDSILYTSTSTTWDPNDCASHTYRVRAVNQCGITKDYGSSSRAYTCCANNPTAVDVTPNGPITVCSGTGRLLTAGLTGGSAPFGYQWYRDGALISGATSSTYLAADSGTHTYNCRLTGSGCTWDIQDSAGTAITWSSDLSFAGVTGVSQLTGSVCGLRVSWAPATASCSGTTVYNVYRSSNPNFTPSASNRVASCVTDTFYDDTTVATGTAYYYLVRAEDGTVGNGGPCNDGLEDANAVKLPGVGGGGTVTLYSESFDSWAAGDWAGWSHGSFGGTDGWNGVRACAAASGANILRFGDAASCTGTYLYDADAIAYPDMAPIQVPGTATATGLSFNHRFQYGATDGGLLYVANGTSYPTFYHVPQTYLSGQQYTGYIGTGTGTNNAFMGSSTSYPTYQATTVNLGAFCTANTANGFTANCAGNRLYLGFNGYSSGLLLDQTSDSTSTGGSSCQDFEAAYNAYDAEGADDFTVPAGVTWTLEEVYVAGFYNAGGCHLDSVDVVVYSNSGSNLPNTAVCTNSGVSGSNLVDYDGEVSARLPTPCTLTGGGSGTTYWLGVQGNMSISGNGQWYRLRHQATHGNGAAWRNPGNGFGTGCTAWTRLNSCGTAGDPDYTFSLYGSQTNAAGWFVDDVQLTAATGSACTTAPNPVQFFTVTSTSTQNDLEWVNPSSGTYGATTIRYRTDGVFPTSPSDGTLVVTRAGTGGAYDTYTHGGLANNTTYHYTAFVNTASDLSGLYSGAMTVSGRPQVTTGPVKWVFNTGASALAPPGIGSVYATSNDRAVHAMVSGSTGGTWPSPPSPTWQPRVMARPAQGRPAVAPLSTGKIVAQGSQDGYVYKRNAVTGAPSWSVQPAGAGSMIQASPAGMFSEYFAGAPDLVLVGTRTASANNVFYGLNLATGSSTLNGWSFNNGGGANGIGIISADAYVVYGTTPRVYFTSRTRVGGSSGTLWCLEFTQSSATKCNGGVGWPVTGLGNIDSAPVVRGNTVYVGNNIGTVYAINATTGATNWSYATGDGPVKGFIWADWAVGSDDLYLSTTNRVWSLEDAGSHLRWSSSVVSLPSTPVYLHSFGQVLVGSGDGKVYRLSAATGSDAGVASWPVTLGAGNAAVGSPAFDGTVTPALAYAGTESGAVYAVVVQ